MSGIKINTIRSKKSPSSKKTASLEDILNKDISFSSIKWNDAKKELLYSELAILLKSGMDVRMSLELIQEGQKKDRDKQTLQSILDDVITGASLSQALLNSNKFTDYEHFSIKIGEETGKLDEVLENLASFYKKRIQQRRQVINALAYPVIVLFIAFGVTLFMMYVVVPMFADIFKRFGSDLPPITKFIIGFSEGIITYFPWIFFVIISISIGLFTQRKMIWYKKSKDLVIAGIPFFGELFRKNQLSQFCNVMSLLIGAKIHLLQALELAEKITDFYPVKSAITSIKKDVLQGKPFHKSLSKFPVFDNKMISLLKVGEEVNQLEKFFNKIAEQYNDEVEHKTSVLGNFVEPILLIFLGIVVGTILVAMYLPMFKLSATFSG